MKRIIRLWILVFGFNFSYANNCAGFIDVSDTDSICKNLIFAKEVLNVHGYQDGTFRPNNKVFRAEFIKMVIEADGANVKGDYEKNCFPDVREGDWYHEYVCSAKDRGIINGYKDGYFKPNNTITYVEALKVLLHVFDKQPQSTASDIWYVPYLSIADTFNLTVPPDSQKELLRKDTIQIVRQAYSLNAIVIDYSDYEPIVITFNHHLSNQMREDEDTAKYMFLFLLSYFYTEGYWTDGFSEKILDDAIKNEITKGRLSGLDVLIPLIQSYSFVKKVKSTHGKISLSFQKHGGTKYLNGDLYMAGSDLDYKFVAKFSNLDEEETNKCGCTLGEIESIFTPKPVPNCHNSWNGWGSCPLDCMFKYCDELE